MKNSNELATISFKLSHVQAQNVINPVTNKSARNKLREK